MPQTTYNEWASLISQGSSIQSAVPDKNKQMNTPGLDKRFAGKGGLSHCQGQ